MRFRPELLAPAETITVDAVRSLAADVLAPGHFYLGPRIEFKLEHVAAETSAWEVFRGRLLEPRYTRETATFEAWNVYVLEAGIRSGEPLLSLKLDATAARVHVVRGFEAYVWEGYDSGGGVFLSRETIRWVRELCGTIDLREHSSMAEFADELVCQVHNAVVGASRLPLTSVEAPLPLYTLGQLAWCYRPGIGFKSTHARNWRELLDRTAGVSMNDSERAKVLQTLALVTDDIADLAAVIMSFTPDVFASLGVLFNEVSLSPWTGLSDRLLQLIVALEDLGQVARADSVDFLCRLVVQICRHLTAYDLITFHHRGANYPDTLLLDAVLKHLFGVIQSSPRLFLDEEQRLRRRALRMGCLLRRHYEGLAVPETPTSPGENNRVWPAQFPRVPEEQILHPVKRPRRLYDGDPLAAHLSDPVRHVLAASFQDLRLPSERRELGLALYLDRPFGAGKLPGEPDGTLLLSHLAHSPSIAQTRLRLLAEYFGPLAGGVDFTGIRLLLEADRATGMPLAELAATQRPGAVSVADALQAAEDFAFLWTTPTTAAELFAQFDFAPLWERFRLEDVRTSRRLLIVPRSAGTLTIHDEQHRPRIELAIDNSAGFARRAGREFPRAGLRIQRVWEFATSESQGPAPPVALGLRIIPLRGHR